MTTVTLYGVDDDYGSGPPRIVSAQAGEYRRTYRLDSTETKAFLKYKIIIKKGSWAASLTPKEALNKYIHRQEQIIRRGLRAAASKAEAKALLLVIS